MDIESRVQNIEHTLEVIKLYLEPFLKKNVPNFQGFDPYKYHGTPAELQNIFPIHELPLNVKHTIMSQVVKENSPGRAKKLSNIVFPAPFEVHSKLKKELFYGLPSDLLEKFSKKGTQMPGLAFWKFITFDAPFFLFIRKDGSFEFVVKDFVFDTYEALYHKKTNSRDMYQTMVIQMLYALWIKYGFYIKESKGMRASNGDLAILSQWVQQMENDKIGVRDVTDAFSDVFNHTPNKDKSLGWIDGNQMSFSINPSNTYFAKAFNLNIRYILKDKSIPSVVNVVNKVAGYYYNNDLLNSNPILFEWFGVVIIEKDDTSCTGENFETYKKYNPFFTQQQWMQLKNELTQMDHRYITLNIDDFKKREIPMPIDTLYYKMKEFKGAKNRCAIYLKTIFDKLVEIMKNKGVNSWNIATVKSSSARSSAKSSTRSSATSSARSSTTSSARSSNTSSARSSS